MQRYKHSMKGVTKKSRTAGAMLASTTAAVGFLMLAVSALLYGREANLGMTGSTTLFLACMGAIYLVIRR